MPLRDGAPRARQERSERVFHGTSLVDDYAWMLAAESEEMREHLAAEHAYATEILATAEGLRETVLAEMLSRLASRSSAPPTRNGDWWYFTRRPEGAAHLQYWRRAADKDTEAQLILDGNAVAEELGGFSLGAFRPSPDHRLLAFGVDAVGNERFTLMFRDLSTGTLLPDRLEGCHYSCVWYADARQVLYTTADASNRPGKVWRHTLGTPQSADELVLEEPDPSVWVTLGSMRSGDLLFARSVTGTSTEHRLLDARDPEAKPVVVRPREDGFYYEVDHQRGPAGEDRLFVLHNGSGADFELSVTSFEDNAEWRTVLPHQEGRRLHWAMAFERHVVVYTRTHGRTGLIVLDPDGGARPVEFGEPGVVVSPASNPEYRTSTFRYSYTSPVTPPSIRSLDLVTGESTTVDQMPVGPAPDGRPYDPADYVSEELWAEGFDGTPVPISLVRRADLPTDRPNPCVLYAYGAYERTADMGFATNRLSLLDRGFVYAVAHVRGGGELGKAWHQGGRLAAKRNSVEDYLACAHHLVDEGRTAAGLIVGRSSSAGGLVVGGALNAEPGLFGAVVLAAPMVDPLTSLLDPDRPLTVSEWDELGNPVADPEAFARIRSLSPYENVAQRDYPPVLAISGTEDARVSVAEPARWVARLRERATGGPFMLLPEFGAGHRGPAGQREKLARDALVTAWIVGTAGA